MLIRNAEVQSSAWHFFYVLNIVVFRTKLQSDSKGDFLLLYLACHISLQTLVACRKVKNCRVPSSAEVYL